MLGVRHALTSGALFGSIITPKYQLRKRIRPNCAGLRRIGAKIVTCANGFDSGPYAACCQRAMNAPIGKRDALADELHYRAGL